MVELSVRSSSLRSYVGGRMVRLFIALLCFVSFSGYSEEGKFPNPLSDVCWECLFPITCSGVNVTPGYSDLSQHSAAVCVCAGTPPKAGIPITFWEPTKLVDVTRHAYKLLGLGGVTVGKESIKNRGSIGIVGDGPSQNSFYHVHFYTYPPLAMLEVLTGLDCIEKSEVNVFYMSELDPAWGDDTLSLLLSPEAALFAVPAAQLSCVADCAASSADRPQDALFWCAGCEGSLYPLTGTVAHHSSSVQASSLILQRVIAKMHRIGVQKGFENNNYCLATPMPIVKKSQYKTQMIYPTTQTSGPCHALGKTDLIWGSNKSFPKGGEDFVYMLWTKKQCCLDAVKPTIVGGI